MYYKALMWEKEEELKINAHTEGMNGWMTTTSPTAIVKPP
jgi:hypothetical protein